MAENVLLNFLTPSWLAIVYRIVFHWKMRKRRFLPLSKHCLTYILVTNQSRVWWIVLWAWGGVQEVWISSKNALPVGSSRGLRYWRVTHKEPAGTSGGLGMWPIQDQYAENDTDEQQFIHTLWLLWANSKTAGLIVLFFNPLIAAAYFYCVNSTVTLISIILCIFGMWFGMFLFLCRCFSRSDHLALHMKRHIWGQNSEGAGERKEEEEEEEEER